MLITVLFISFTSQKLERKCVRDGRRENGTTKKKRQNELRAISYNAKSIRNYYGRAVAHMQTKKNPRLNIINY